MAKAEPTTHQFRMEAPDFKCPACGESIPVVANVEVDTGDVRHVGTKGFDKQYSINVKTKLKGFVIHHECDAPSES